MTSSIPPEASGGFLSSLVSKLGTAALAAVPALAAGAVAWGAVTTKVDTNTAGVGKLWTHVNEQDARLRTVEQNDAAILARLNDLKDGQDRIERLVEARR